MTEPRVYIIPEQNLPRLRSDIERLNKRARRLHLPPIVLTVIDTVTKTIVDDAGGFRVEWVSYLVTVDGATPRLNGWVFLAALSHVEGQVITTTKEGAALPDWAKNASPENCDHCHTKRDRLTTFVVQHEDGRTAQVGRNCLADFVRTTDPGNLAEQAEFLLSLDFGEYEDDEGREGGAGRRVRDRVNAADFTAYTLRAIALQGGFVSKRRGDLSAKDIANQPTVQVVSDLLWPGVKKVQLLTDDERDRSLSVIEAALDLTAKPGLSEYEENVRTVALMPYWEERLWGIAASIPSYVNRSKTRAAVLAKQAEAKSQLVHVGTVGKRQVFTLTMHGAARLLKGDNGRSVLARGRDFTTYLYKFTDPDGNEVAYFSSKILRAPTGAMHTTTRRVETKHAPEDRCNPVSQNVYMTCGKPRAEHPTLYYGDDVAAPHDFIAPSYCSSACENEDQPYQYPVERDMMDGDTVTMKASVKRHDAFQGVPQTLITRGAVLSLVSEAPGGGK